MYVLQVIICLLIGYLCGSFLTAVIITRIRTGKSISSIGSGNPGMANVMANIGKFECILVLIGDVLKVALACFLAWLLTWEVEPWQVILWTGFATIPGHNYPFWRRFRGGKGVAVTCAWLVFSMPLWGSAACIIGGLVTLLSGYLPIGAVLIPVLAVAPAFACYGVVPGILVCLSAFMMFHRHWDGIKRCFTGAEKKRFRKVR